MGATKTGQDMRCLVVSLALLAALFTLALALAPPADAHVYWTTRSGNIGRANLDGTGVNRTFLSFPDSTFVFRPHDIAIGGGHIYWANWSTYIGRAKIDGTGVRNSFITSKTSPFSVAIGGQHIYWTTPTNAIVRANLDGSRVRPKFITTDRGQPGSIAVGGGHIYWTNWAYWMNPVNGELGSGWIARANLDGTGAKRFVATGSEEESPTDVAVVPGAPRHGG